MDDKSYKKMLQDHKNRVVKSEAHLENIFCEKVKEAGGWALKLNPALNSGLPDRIVFYKGFSWLVELKTPTGRVSPVQESIHKRFKVFGFHVRIVRTKEDIEKFINEMLEIIL